MLGHASATLASDVALPTAGAWVDGPSLSLAAGTWLLVAHAHFRTIATTITRYNARLSTGTVHYASGEVSHPSANPSEVMIALTAIVALAGTTTVKLQGACNVTSSNVRHLKAATADQASGANATRLIAVRLA